MTYKHVSLRTKNEIIATILESTPVTIGLGDYRLDKSVDAFFVFIDGISVHFNLSDEGRHLLIKQFAKSDVHRKITLRDILNDVLIQRHKETMKTLVRIDWNKTNQFIKVQDAFVANTVIVVGDKNYVTKLTISPLVAKNSVVIFEFNNTSITEVATLHSGFVSKFFQNEKLKDGSTDGITEFNSTLIKFVKNTIQDAA